MCDEEGVVVRLAFVINNQGSKITAALKGKENREQPVMPIVLSVLLVTAQSTNLWS